MKFEFYSKQLAEYALRLNFIQSPFLLRIPHISEANCGSPYCEEGMETNGQAFLAFRGVYRDNFGVGDNFGL